MKRLLVGLGARGLAGDQVFGLGNPLVALDATLEIQFFVELGDVGLGPFGDLGQAGNAFLPEGLAPPVRISVMRTSVNS